MCGVNKFSNAGRGLDNIPASFKTLRRAQYFMIIARGRTLGSIFTYVFIRRVLCKASVLLILISQAKRLYDNWRLMDFFDLKKRNLITYIIGSHSLTMGTLAFGTQ